MIITREQIEQLSRIYNTMLEIGTKGEDTLVMADCLRALQQVITQIVNNAKSPAAADEQEITTEAQQE